MIVTLTTDFGHRDGYVAAMKGAMLCVAPGVRFVDVTHEVPAQDVMAAAFTLRQAAPHFPEGTVHLVVVDPGVGTARRAIAARVRLGGGVHGYVGPDNGLLALLVAEDAVVEAVELPVGDGASATFHGRDVFGPAAAALADGAALDALGEPAEALTPMHWPLPQADADGVYGMVLHVDRFGNCITNIARDDVERFADGRPFKCVAGSSVFRAHTRTYGDLAPGDALTLFGSSGQLEIAVNRGDAAALLSLHRGDAVSLVFEDAPVPTAP